jgi:hypothetical protein
VFVFIISERLLTGKKPPDEIIVIDKLNELKILKPKKFNIIKIKKVNEVYKIKIFKYCFNDSAILKDKKFVNDFLRLTSNISINKIIEKRK